MDDDSSVASRLAPSAWTDSYRSLVRVARPELTAADLEVLAVAAYLFGDDGVSAEAWEAAYGRHLDEGDRADAARCSFWLALTSMLQGRMAHAGGWLARAEKVLGDDRECPAAGYLLIPGLLGSLESGDVDGALGLAIQAGEVGARFDDADLVALATLGHGQALLAGDDTAAGLAKLDELMLSVKAGEVGPIASGIVYCAVILECMQVLDLARATEWTDALDAWCQAQPDLVPYRGQCLVHQSQLHQAAGDWQEAAATAALARERLSDPPHPALGLALYQEAELLRVLGSLDAAAEAYAQASRAGYEPMPGLALLSLAHGEVQVASAGIRRVLGETSRPVMRPPLLSAAVEIHRAAGDRDAARAAALELEDIAKGSTSEVMRALAEDAVGSVGLDDGDVAGALGHLRVAAEAWRKLSMPYHSARTGVSIGLGCAALGDGATAALEFENARATFTALGAAPDLARLESLAGGLTPGSRAGSDTGPLSARELEVLAHVAAGRSSPEIAEELSISQHTVRRHLGNIFAKLGVNSRAAATAYAYEHGLL